MDRRKVIMGGIAAASIGGVAYLTVSGMGSAHEYTSDLARSRTPLANQANARDLIRYATLAPNGHNTQP